MGKVCKGSGVAILILGFIVGLVISSQTEEALPFVYFTVGGFVSFLFIYGLGEIIDTLFDINEKLGKGDNQESDNDKTEEYYEYNEADFVDAEETNDLYNK